MTQPPRSFTAACIQVNAGREVYPNVEAASALVREARERGADMVFMPENVAMMEWGRRNIQAKAMPEEDHVALTAFRDLARDLHIWLHCGTLAVAVGDGMVANRTYVVDSDGAIRGRYDKIHMFDVNLADGESYKESSTFQAGSRAVALDIPFGRLGLSICYDLRFPHLFRALAKAGCHYLTIPAAFTRTTGEAHWHVLQRTRAIETGCYVISPAQTGTHAEGRQTYGHALIIDPWGRVLADAGEAPGIILAKIDPEKVVEARAMVPSLSHDRVFALDTL
ncbi:carbon-nitrogen hydrolase family protein [Rhodospirillum rubrum]|uniref:Nitrilase/cyanide hydratase and apolipoprotein N-acyltransferase n=1 Tax=Rhodospirillum rubrum (strain ATCC 11170 / ATH 1.1.1 / DSM 467 / LMG 4362 / NCIMB 8255 / S1) TaxID=269796 RepID=Q2RWF2_RHORT|nr:carbon-nitrogen hydrolase family protein [Rhodospirillum rubrum]ABC21543.1 Nitrilase/cyanide hydratase and apolipoprotein N-acyltransferase [Rhodospirillum rubrum ATCC 11170]AEO47228.1 bifunctional nitrilase/cyanide hydratase/apolipoprotein N-acyltransferase [Rhodospirillum rubrum F11]MBK5953165.1 amidohydrolase [Rhodospirillum rubrum]QXG81215.1 carbon-nitrogen hydrolase family protein [Rhodospirillum rubrum]HAQ01262.1 carbon-nitrogen hydrolase family protein [Rhodospirillum rubrum]